MCFVLRCGKKVQKCLAEGVFDRHVKTMQPKICPSHSGPHAFNPISARHRVNSRPPRTPTPAVALIVSVHYFLSCEKKPFAKGEMRGRPNNDMF
jgi:hypothetical protein